MKRLLSATLAIALLAGCSSAPQIVWQENSQVTMNQVSIELKSNLWVNLMPTIGEVQEQNVHGALYLQANKDLPANLTVDALIIKQGDSEWQINGDLLELRTHSENQWEVVFVWQIEANMENPVDIALLLDDAGKQAWLVEKGIRIDKVY
ncbi:MULTISPECIES: lipoprotein [Vibrio]|jgi:PBP1b-binding outer membrane lipoprotein LpoB|uniref:lipoprotein n=1 Tax=Vibrio TaxID=662 RepID=UPI000BFFABB2|nr:MULTISPECIES: lipoprotein [unclassified Vibrio]PHJ42415.1 DNA polymerase III subunit beta [Vibrio sp. PID17_43]RIZ54668.1 DNA polymerase III subunit beta [Vibrio sp. PID23_8]